MGTVEIPGLDIWEKFEDLSLPPFSPNLSFEETSFDDIFSNQLEGESLYIKDNLIFSNSLESSFSCDDSFRCENVNTVIIDHTYAQKEHYNHKNHFILNKSEDKLESIPIDKLFSGIHEKSLKKKFKSKKKQKPRTNVIFKHSTKCVENNNFEYKVKSLTNHSILLFKIDF